MLGPGVSTIPRAIKPKATIPDNSGIFYLKQRLEGLYNKQVMLPVPDWIIGNNQKYDSLHTMVGKIFF